MPNVSRLDARYNCVLLIARGMAAEPRPVASLAAMHGFNLVARNVCLRLSNTSAAQNTGFLRLLVRLRFRFVLLRYLVGLVRILLRRFNGLVGFRRIRLHDFLQWV
jgi:hypothetical protein